MVQQGKSCVVDNTNRDKVTRARYIALAKKHDVACRVFVWENDAKLAWHNNLYRAFVKPVVDGQVCSSFPSVLECMPDWSTENKSFYTAGSFYRLSAKVRKTDHGRRLL